MTRVVMVITQVRVEEKMLLEAFQQRGIDPELIRDEELVINPSVIDPRWDEFDIVLQRTLSTSRGLYLLELFDAWGSSPRSTACALPAFVPTSSRPPWLSPRREFPSLK